MHELSIAQALAEQVQRAAQAHGARRVTGVTVAVGALSGVDPEALALAFPLAVEDTPLAGVGLTVTAVPAGVRCRACGADSQPEPLLLRCAACGGADVEITRGRELLLTAVELEVEEDRQAGAGVASSASLPENG